MDKDLIQEGFWSIATQKHLTEFTTDSSNIDEFDNLGIAGKAGRFLGVIRRNGKIDNIKKLEKMANNVGILKSDLYRIILPEIAKASDGQVEVIRDSADNVTGIVEYLFDNSSVLELAGKVFEQQNPTDIERIAITTMDETRKIPYLESEMGDILSKQGYTEERIHLSLALQDQFKLIQLLRLHDKLNPIISNEYVWGKNHKKIASTISTLELISRQSLGDIIALVQSTQGIPVECLPEIDPNIMTLAQKTGMILPTKVCSTRGFDKEFIFSADLISKLDYQDDILDDVKLLLASIRFGQNYTQYSRINDPDRFLRALIENEYVGPHSANETDYTLLEKRGIVKVEQVSLVSTFAGRTRTGSCLKLLRKDVAEKALNLINDPTYLASDANEIGSVDAMLTASGFISPEEARIKLGTSPTPVKEAEEYLSRVLRDENI